MNNFKKELMSEILYYAKENDIHINQETAKSIMNQTVNYMFELVLVEGDGNPHMEDEISSLLRG